ncbi:hypothetical protein MKK75_00075 [Methylobacterium sp. J-030]|uniref:hypothetical protein n=1 Tax=unclassified Methylobacterium TaxID=2615210 RepID=UPI001FB969C9|nr:MULTISPECIES: hypothetical protein [unclassified Methylobacterium]MCJ2012494.1 hypothetical protein [Methylobacterium sp. J-076]MCJ2067218.1 hypothetical protein [Methylobacterium sp. J-030]MCJ2103026.1 hypothetical protein [Methylobacterium sp. E-046]
MKILNTLSVAAAITLLGAGIASAKPCAVGTTTNSTGQVGSADASSKVDGDTTAKVSPGAKAESPGTVGAMNNVGSNATPATNEAKPPEGKVVKPGDDDC